MTIKYRDHRGSLSDSMLTVIEVESKQDIINHLNKFYKQFGKEVCEIKFVYSTYDDRIKWDTYYVLQKLKESDEFTIAGMSNGIV